MSPDRPASEEGAPKRAESLLAGASVMAVRRYVSAAMAWAGTVIIIRSLTPEAWGAYSFVFSLLGLVGFISDLQIARVALQQVDDTDADAAANLGSYVSLRALIGLVSYGAAMAVVVASGQEAAVVHAAAIAGLSLVAGSVAAGFELGLRARLWMRDLAIAGIAGQAFQMVGIIGLALTGNTTLVLFTVPSVFLPLVQIVLLRRRMRAHVSLTVRPGLWWVWMKEAAPLAIGAAMAHVYFRIDTVMLAELDSLTAAGRYSIGYKFSDLLQALPSAALYPAFTVLVQSYHKAPGRFAGTFRQMFVLLVVAAGVVTVAFFVYAEDAIALFYGDRWVSSAPAARGLVAGQSLNFFTLAFFNVLAAAGRNRLYPLATLTGVVTNVALNAWLIPDHSFHGAAVATVATEVAVVAILGAGVIRVPGVGSLPAAPILRVAAAAVAMVAVALLTGPLPWILSAALATATYFGVLHVIGVDGPGGLRVLAARWHD